MKILKTADGLYLNTDSIQYFFTRTDREYDSEYIMVSFINHDEPDRELCVCKIGEGEKILNKLCHHFSQKDEGYHMEIECIKEQSRNQK